MKNKTIFIILLIILLIVGVFTARHFLKDSWKIIDLRRSMPKGNFLEAKIVGVDFNGKETDQGWFEIPRDRIREFEKRFRECVEKARIENLLAPTGMIRMEKLKIITDKGRYAMYLEWTDDEMIFDGSWRNWRTLKSKEMRQLFLEMGLRKNAEH